MIPFCNNICVSIGGCRRHGTGPVTQYLPLRTFFESPVGLGRQRDWRRGGSQRLRNKGERQEDPHSGHPFMPCTHPCSLLTVAPATRRSGRDSFLPLAAERLPTAEPTTTCHHSTPSTISHRSLTPTTRTRSMGCYYHVTKLARPPEAVDLASTGLTTRNRAPSIR